MTHRTTHEMKAEIKTHLQQITLILAEIEAPLVEISEIEGTGTVIHPRSAYLGCVKEICQAILEEDETAEIIVSRCV